MEGETGPAIESEFEMPRRAIPVPGQEDARPADEAETGPATSDVA